MPGLSQATSNSEQPENMTEQNRFKNLGAPEQRNDPVFVNTVKENCLHSPNSFVLPPHYKKDIQGVMIPKGQVADRTEKIAIDIRDLYGNEEVHMICVLKGSRGFFSQICEFLTRFHLYDKSKPQNVPYLEHYVRLKSYHNTESSGELTVQADDLSCLAGKHVLIVEDIIDTGNTLTKFCKYLKDFSPQSIRVATLLEKRTPKSVGFKADFVGFSVPDEFIVGYCLDYNEYFRDLDHICVLTPQAIKDYAIPAKEKKIDRDDELLSPSKRQRASK